MKIAFTSCLDTVNDPTQPGWIHMAQHEPDHVVLLGDSIYMDYGLGDHKRNGSPRNDALPQFSDLMYRAYRAQWNVANFRDAIHGRTVHAIWDDHDFAWNNARGGGPHGGDDHVPPDYRRLSRLQFETWRQALRSANQSYPANPRPDGTVADDLGTIAETVPLEAGVVMHLVDTRSFREEEGRSMLGQDQQEKLVSALLPEPGINIIASSSTLKEWRDYEDHDWLRELSKRHRLLMLSGDVHEPDFRVRHRLYEATASAMAQPPGPTRILGKRTEVFGILTIEPAQLVVELHVGDRRVERHTIDRADWSLDD
jgi:alkaline phosphatase D